MTTEQTPLEALTRDGDDNFWGQEQPRCPHCGEACDVSENEWYRLYEEGEHEVECPHCDLDFAVSTRVSFSFSTDQQ